MKVNTKRPEETTVEAGGSKEGSGWSEGPYLQKRVPGESRKRMGRFFA
jgi:hypothetical protein